MGLGPAQPGPSLVASLFGSQLAPCLKTASSPDLLPYAILWDFKLPMEHYLNAPQLGILNKADCSFLKGPDHSYIALTSWP